MSYILLFILGLMVGMSLMCVLIGGGRAELEQKLMILRKQLYSHRQ